MCGKILLYLNTLAFLGILQLSLIIKRSMTENAFQSQLLYLRTVTRASAFRTQITCFICMYTA